MYTVSQIIDDPIFRSEAIDVITARAIMLADSTGCDSDRFPTIAEGKIHEAASFFIKDFDTELERDDDRGRLAERAYDIIWNPCCDRIWKEARSRVWPVIA